MPLRDHPGFAEVAYMMDIGRYTLKGLGLALQGGLGSHFEKKADTPIHPAGSPTYFLFRAGSGYTIARRFRLQASVEMRLWERIEKPRIELGLSIPFGRSALRWVN
jgi:hypothetical protein